ncbi:MAG: hypothetical protein E6I52_23205 [Chloroflexi bacterium]|nr:MAG: hypothetical protein E6I52_23205 [Chloroflexota bacterium]
MAWSVLSPDKSASYALETVARVLWVQPAESGPSGNDAAQVPGMRPTCFRKSMSSDPACRATTHANGSSGAGDSAPPNRHASGQVAADCEAVPDTHAAPAPAPDSDACPTTVSTGELAASVDRTPHL